MIDVLIESDVWLVSVAAPQLTGVLLQWSILFEPYALNFIQYRAVVNLTLSESGNDLSTPFTTLPMSFENAITHQFTVPQHALIAGAYYEFRLGYPFESYTYYTNSMFTKTFDASSPFVNNVQTWSIDTMLSVSWGEPEYSDGIVGYNVSIWYAQIGNAGIARAQTWNISTLNLVTSFDLTLAQTSFVYGCTALGASDCLWPFTTYVVGVSVIRQTGVDVPEYIYVSTMATAVASHNTSSLFLYGGRINMHFVGAVPMSANATIGSTFLSPVRLINEKGDLSLNLTESTVVSSSNTSVHIFLSGAEYLSLVSTIYLPAFTFSSMTLLYGNGQSIPLSIYCL